MAVVPAAKTLEVPAIHAAPEETKVDPARGYNELLDTFSLHQFIIRRGDVLSSTPEFQSFKRKYTSLWGRVQQVVSALQRLLSRFNVPMAHIDGHRVVLLAEVDTAK